MILTIKNVITKLCTDMIINLHSIDFMPDGLCLLILFQYDSSVIMTKIYILLFGFVRFSIYVCPFFRLFWAPTAVRRFLGSLCGVRAY